jgi:hypothetical protein
VWLAQVEAPHAMPLPASLPLREASADASSADASSADASNPPVLPEPAPLDVLPPIPAPLEEPPVPLPLLLDNPPHDAALLDIELPEELPACAPLEPPVVPSVPPSPPPPPMTEPPAPLHATKPDKVTARTTSGALDMEDPPLE